MSQNSARIALGVASLAAAAGVAFFFVAGDGAKVRSATVAQNPSGGVYPVLPVPSTPEHSQGWEKPSLPDDDLWTYDLFTPVEIKWNPATSVYEPKGLVPPKQVPFGLQLLSLSHPRYRYKLNALFESKDPLDSIIVLHDDTTHDSVRGKPGQTVGPEGGKITIVSYENKAINRPDGSIDRPVTVKLKDLTLGREITVSRDPTVFADKIAAVFAAEGTVPVWTAVAVGDKFENDAGAYVIKGIDFDAQAVTVEKTWTDDSPKKVRKTVVETLSPAPPPASVKPASPAKK